MSTKLAATLLFSTLALAADREKIFSLAYTENSKQMNEIATVIRSSTEDRTLMVDEGRKTLTTKGTEQQIAITDWLLKQLDVPASAIPAGGEYKAGDDDFVQVRRFPLSMGVRPIQEIVTAIRSAVELRRMFIYASPNPAAVVIRGTRAELAMAQWLFRNVLDKPAAGEFAAAGGDFVRLFYLKNFEGAQNLQELTTTIRSITEIRRMFLYTPSTALIMRSPGDLNLAQWLIGELDKPAPLNSSNPEFRSGSDDVTRVFGIKQPISVQELQKLVTSVRSATEVKRAFTLSAKNAIVIRGSPAQIRKAQTMLEGR